MKYDIRLERNVVYLTFKPVLSQEMIFEMSQEHLAEWPVRFFTATSNMKDFIGNIVSIEDGRCEVKGFWQGHNTVVKNIKLIDNATINSRTMVTEHINIHGQYELLSSKKRILVGDTNFINIGWSDEKRCRYRRIDIYTGEAAYLKSEPCFAFLLGKDKQG